MIRTILLAAVATGAVSAAGPAPLTYRFDEVKSKVYRAPAGDEKLETRVSAGEWAAPGDLVRTGFWASTVLAVQERKARFEIGASSKARLAGGEPGVLLVLEKGRLKAFFEKLTEGDLVERTVAAPGALLAVRGTRYGLEVGGDGKCLLAVFEGTVEVIPTTPGLAPIQVRAGEACTFSPKTAPHSMPMKAMGMSEGSWGMHGGMGGMGQPPGTTPGGMMPQSPGGSMHGSSPMGTKKQ
jgi:hypothetical protein